jgi:hypothetical protein
VPVFVVVKRRSYGGLGIGYLTEEIRTRTILRIQEVVDEARVRSDTLMTKHQSALVMVATAVYEHRRLTDDRLDALLRSAGFRPSRPTALFVSEMVFALRRRCLAQSAISRAGDRTTGSSGGPLPNGGHDERLARSRWR